MSISFRNKYWSKNVDNANNVMFSKYFGSITLHCTHSILHKEDKYQSRLHVQNSPGMF